MKTLPLGVGIHNLGFPIDRFKRFRGGGMGHGSPDGPGVGLGGGSPGHGSPDGPGVGLGSNTGGAPTGGGPQSAAEADAASRAARAGVAQSALGQAAAQAAADIAKAQTAASAPTAPSTAFSADPDFGQALDARIGRARFGIADPMGLFGTVDKIDVTGESLLDTIQREGFPITSIQALNRAISNYNANKDTMEAITMARNAGFLSDQQTGELLQGVRDRYGLGPALNRGKVADDAGEISSKGFLGGFLDSEGNVNKDALDAFSANLSDTSKPSFKGTLSLDGLTGVLGQVDPKAIKDSLREGLGSFFGSFSSPFTGDRSPRDPSSVR